MRFRDTQNYKREGTFPLIPLFFLYYVCIGMFLTIGVTVGDTLFLTHSAQERIQTFYAWGHVGVALSMMLVTWGYAHVMERVSRITLIIGLQAFLALSLLIFHQWLRSDYMPKTIWSYFGLLIWLKVCAQLLIMLFFSFAGDYFTTRKARQIYGYLVGGLSVGSILAGWLITPLLSILTALDMLYVCVGLLVAGIGFAKLISTHGVPLMTSNSEPAPLQSESTSLRQIFRNPYLALLFLTVFFRVVCFVFVDFQMKMTAGATYPNSAELAGFFGKFYMYLGLVTIVVQFLLIKVLLQKLGIITCLVFLPVVYIVMGGLFYNTGYYGSLAHFSLLIIAATNFLRLLFSESLDLPSRELLLLPLPPFLRIRAQAVMAGFVEPFSQGLGGLLVIGLSAFGMRLFQYSGAIMICSIIWIILLLFERPRYQQTLLASLHRTHLNTADLQEILLVPHSEQIVQELLRNPEEHVVSFTLDMLKGRSIEAFIPNLHLLARHASSTIATKAIELLGQDGEYTHVPLLEQCLENACPDGRKAALLALCQIQQDDALERIHQWLTSSDAVIRDAALIGAGRLIGHAGQHILLPILQHMTASPLPEDRMKAAKILSEIGDPAYTDVIRPLLQDSDETVQIVAVKACGALRAFELVPLVIQLLNETAVRPAVLEALEQMPQESVPLIISALYQPDFDETLRDVLFQVLASIGGSAAQQALWAFFSSHAPVVTRISAGHALQLFAQHHQWQRIHGPEFSTRLRVLCDNIAMLNRACRELGHQKTLLWQFLHEQAYLEIECLFLLLSYRFSARQIGQISYNFFSSTSVQRANALELLDALLPRRVASDVIGLLDEFSQPVSGEQSGLSHELQHSLRQKEPWLRVITTYFSDHDTDSSLNMLTPYERDMYNHVAEVIFLKNGSLFVDVPGNYLVSLAHIAQPVRVQRGETLFSQGDPGNAMYLICQGTIRIMVGEQELVRQGRGDCIGEMSILDGAPRSASCIAAKDSELLMLYGKDVEHLLLNQTSVALALLRTLAARLRQQTLHAVQPPHGDQETSYEDLENRKARSVPPFENNQNTHTLMLHENDSQGLYHQVKRMVFLRRVPLFREVPDKYLLALAELTRPIRLHREEILFKQGDVGDAMYLLQHGTISVQVNGLEVNRMEEGDCIGEMALLDNAPRSASCGAGENAELLKISASDFETVVRSQPSVALALLRTLAARLRHQTAKSTNTLS